MNFWNAHDLAVVDLREKIIDLTEEFEKKFGRNIQDYNIKFERFLKQRLRKQSDFIFKSSILMTTNSLILQNRNI